MENEHFERGRTSDLLENYESGDWDEKRIRIFAPYSYLSTPEFLEAFGDPPILVRTPSVTPAMRT